MDRTSNSLESIPAWVEQVNEQYLVSIANKGLYNRACKDLESLRGGLVLELEEAGILCSFPDGQQCFLTGNLQTTTCTCPTRGTCRHMLVGLLKLKEEFELQKPLPGSEAEEARGPQFDFSKIREVSLEDLRKRGGTAAFQEAVCRLEFGVVAQIQVDSVLVISFPGEGIRVRFLPDADLNQALCSCNSTSFCRHRVEAVLNFQLSLGLLSIGKLREQLPVELPKDTLGQAKSLLGQMLHLGLARVPESFAEQLGQMAVMCHGAGLANLEQRFRQLQGEVAHYQKRQVTSQRSEIRRLWAETYGLLWATENTSLNPKARNQLVGEFRTRYFEVPPMVLHGLGAGLWSSSTGYDGIEFYFWLGESHRLLTFSISRPTYYERDTLQEVNGMYKSMGPWQVGVDSGVFARSVLHLFGAKVNTTGRLSSSEQTKGERLGSTDWQAIDLSAVQVSDWEVLVQKLQTNDDKRQIASSGERKLFLLEPNGWGKGYFDRVYQEYRIPIRDKESRQLWITIKYSQYTKTLIENFERLEKEQRWPEELLADVSIRKGSLQAVPKVAYFSDGLIENLSLEAYGKSAIPDKVMAAEANEGEDGNGAGESRDLNEADNSEVEDEHRKALYEMVEVLGQGEQLLDQVFLAGLKASPASIAEKVCVQAEVYREYSLQRAARHFEGLGQGLEQMRHSFAFDLGTLVPGYCDLVLYHLEAERILDFRMAES